MAANRKMRRELSLDEFRDQAMDAIGQAPGVTLRLGNDETVTIPHPMLIDDQRQVEIDKAQDDDGDESQTIRFARAVLGPEQHEKFLAGGGNSNDVTLAWAWMSKTAEEAGPKLPR